jgi:hypothetical protein
MNWPTKPLSVRARAILMECSSGSSISSIVSSFLTNFGASLATGFFPDDANILLNASSAGIGEEGGRFPPPGVAMEAAWSCPTTLEAEIHYDLNSEHINNLGLQFQFP